MRTLAQLAEQRATLEAMARELDEEREAHTVRVNKFGAREAEATKREEALREQAGELSEARTAWEDEQAEAGWRHWQRDRQRELLREISMKRPAEEWRARMERVTTTLELSERDNERLRRELAQIAAAANVDVAGAAARAGAALERGGGGVSDEVLGRLEAAEQYARHADEAAREARRREKAGAAYLLTLEREAKDTQARNETQQRRLETLTAENSKVKKENVKLRSDATSARMSDFEKELLQQELRVARDAASSMEAQLTRMHAENAGLRDGGGVRDELAATTSQLRDALESKQELQLAMSQQVLVGHAQSALALTALADADEQLDGHGRAAAAAVAAATARSAREHDARALLLAGAALPRAADSASLAWALSTWASAARFAELGSVFGEMRDRVAGLGAETEQLSEEVARLEVAEATGLANHHLLTLHDTWREVMQKEMRTSEERADSSSRAHATAASSLQKREDDLILMISRYEDLQHEHGKLCKEIDSAADGSAAHAHRLEAELEALGHELEETRVALGSAMERAEAASAALGLRERQLAVLVTRLEGSRAEAEALRASGEDARVRAHIAGLEAHLVDLVREIYSLAATEKTPGVVAHDARSRVFRRCATVHELLGPAAFAEAPDRGDLGLGLPGGASADGTEEALQEVVDLVAEVGMAPGMAPELGVGEA